MKILLSFVLLFGMVSSAYSRLLAPSNPEAKRPRIFVGIITGYGRTFYTEGVSIFDSRNFESVQSHNVFTGLYLKYYLGNYRNSSWSNTHWDWDADIAIRIYYNNLATAKSFTSGLAEKIVDVNGQSAVTTQTQYLADFSSSFLNTEFILFQRLPVINAFSIGAGFGIAFPLTGVMEKRFEILKTEGASFPQNQDERFISEENGRILILKEDDISKVIYYAIVGIGYELHLSNYITATPSVFYNFGLNRAVSTEDFKINTLQFSLDFKFAL